ncbi:MAG: hypothetical protein FWE07_07495, partial [Turicibacter sp.]|nr:hypothetical protein [Turicibacter sp.]
MKQKLHKILIALIAFLTIASMMVTGWADDRNQVVVDGTINDVALIDEGVLKLEENDAIQSSEETADFEDGVLVDEYEEIDTLISHAPAGFDVRNLSMDATQDQWNTALAGTGNVVVNVQGNQANMPSTMTISGDRHVIITSSGTNLSNHTHVSAPFVINRTTGTGRHFYVTDGATLTLSQIVLDGGSPAEGTARGGVDVIGGTSQLVMQNGSMIRNNRAVNGGGVLITGGTFNLHGGEIYANIAHSGAGVFLTNANMNQSDGHIHHNRAIATLGHVSATTRGGGVALNGTSTFDMTNGEIHNNYTQGAELQNSGGNGVWMGDETTFNMSGNARIHTNGRTSPGPNVVGGVFLLNSATLNMSGDAQLVDNWGEGSGGGIRARNNATVNLSGNATVARNRTTNLQAGGVMLENNSTLDMSDNALVYDNTAVQNAGGVELRNTAVMTMTDNARIAGNRAGLHGGGMRMLDTSRLTMSDQAIIEGNLAGMTGTGGGGGLHVAGNALAGGVPRVVISDDVIIRNNRAHNGGGLHWNTAGIFNMTGGYIYGHTRQSVNDVPIVDGGGINAVNGTLNVSGGTIRENHAVSGGGMRITVGTLNVSSGYIRNNTAHSGAGVHVDNATMTQSGGHIHHNQGIATPGNTAGMSRGGGVALIGTSTFNMTSGEIRNNDTWGTVEVDRGGSGVWMGDETTFNMSGDARIHTNGRNLTTTNAVGGVFALNNATFNMSDDAQITNNVTNSSGAGIRARNAARV